MRDEELAKDLPLEAKKAEQKKEPSQEPTENSVKILQSPAILPINKSQAVGDSTRERHDEPEQEKVSSSGQPVSSLLTKKNANAVVKYKEGISDVVFEYLKWFATMPFAFVWDLLMRLFGR
jgi:hypothetical protein